MSQLNHRNGMDAARVSQPLIVLLGATAVGKTELSLSLCERVGGEIVGADSRQIYRGMDIGTAKPTEADRARVRHHLIDIRDPDETLTLAEYQRLAYEAIDGIHARGNVPMLVGGTALYVRAVVEGFRIPEAPPNEALRSELEQILELEGRETLFHLLAEKDPSTAAVIDPQNPRRLIRALEVVISTGQSKAELESASAPPFHLLQICLDRPRERLHERIAQRTELMIQQGLIDETKALLAAGFDESLPSMSSLGYKEIATHLRGDISVDEAIRLIRVRTHRYVRQQYTWLRKMPGLAWVDMDKGDGSGSVDRMVSGFLSDPHEKRVERPILE